MLSFFGSSGKRLSLEMLEEMGCNSTCPGIMSSPKEVFLFGCNTLAEKQPDSRTPNQYRELLREELDNAGQRMFSEQQIEEIVAFRYSEFGPSNRERMSAAFSGVPHIYGFDSVGPSGSSAALPFSNYLNSISDYSDHLDQIEKDEAIKDIGDTIDALNRINQGQSPRMQNKKIAHAFRNTHFAQCSGLYQGDSADVCALFADNIPMKEKLLSLKRLLTGSDGSKHLALANRFFEQNPPKYYNPESQLVFDSIRTDKSVQKNYRETLTAMEKMPMFAINLIELGEHLEIISDTVATSKREKILGDLINQGTIDARAPPL